MKATLLGSLDASNPGTYTASQAVEISPALDHSESILQVTYKGNSLLNFLHGVASVSVSEVFVNVLETKNCTR
jgi:hypothetical protein